MSQVAVCFVCLGNICRSPTAEGVFQKLVLAAGLGERIAIDSAGTGAWHVGEAADPRSRAAAERRGYVLSGHARQVTSVDFERFDYLLAMDHDNLRNLEDLARGSGRVGTATPHIALLRDFDKTAPAGSIVPDPYHGGARGFDEVLDICERACRGLLEHITRTHLRA
jgi:protein-tyrosine phosphatase